MSDRLRRLGAQGGWIGVDLDGTLAEYSGFKGAGVIGAPVPRMLRRVVRWLELGVDVRIFTARAGDEEAERAIRAWCEAHLGKPLPVTATKNYQMIELWDDRAVQVVPNTGERADGMADP
jgi:hypothetical protein